MAKLTDKQRAFVEHYLQSWNATDAARRAEYRGTYESLRVIGSQNLTKPKIKAAIEERLSEMVMSANEVLIRLGRIARGEYGHGFSISTAEMIRALELIGKHHILFTDKIKVEDWRSEIIQLIREQKVTREQVIAELGKDLATELFVSAGISISAS